MGLHVIGYESLTEAKNVIIDPDGEILDASGKEVLDVQVFEKDQYFPYHYAGLKEDIPYRYKDSYIFKAGSYRSYNQWREWLRSLSESDLCLEGTFTELINFSDCSGTIGPIVCRKLSQDFYKYAEIVSRNNPSSDQDYYNCYLKFQKVFKLGANHGCVTFG